MRKLIGIIPANDGTFIQVSMIQDQKSWKVANVKRREINNTLGNLLLLNNSVLLGVESHWLHQNIPDYIDLQTAPSSVGNFYTSAPSAQYKFFSDVLRNNLLGVYPEDAYLCTIPLFTTNTPADSFLSLTQEGNNYKVGIVIERQLIVVFSISISDSRQLEGYLSRIKRYWQSLQTEKEFPEILYVINVNGFNIDMFNDIRNISFSYNDLNILKAAGIALCSLEKVVPCFSGASEESHLKTYRAVVNISSVAIILIAILSFVSTGLLNVYYSKKIDKCKMEYNEIIDQNKEIRGLLKTGGNLADKVARIDSVASQQSMWAKLLYFIGSERPQGLFIEKLGSDPMPKSTNIKIAIIGWSLKETAVTDMLKKLNASSIVTDVTLANLERDDKKNNIYQFKILCQLKSGN